MKLNIGAGKTKIAGFTPWDAKDGNLAERVTLPDCSVEEIYASHVLEHVAHRQTLDVLREWFRVLTPGGVLRVAVPDFDAIVQLHAQGKARHMTELWLMGGQVDADDQHRALFNEAKLAALLRAAGFADLRRFTADVGDCSALPISLNIEARKPSNGQPGRLFEAGKSEPEPVAPAMAKESPAAAIPATPTPPPAPEPCQPPKVAARAVPRGLQLTTEEHAELVELARGTICVWTTPRYAFPATFDCIIRSLPPLGISIRRAMGVFWDQCLERIIWQAIADGADSVLTLDFDAVWEPADMHQLLRTWRRHPDLGALCPLQWARSVDKPLWSRRDASGQQVPLTKAELAADAVPVDTAHFGLSFLRCSHLAKMPRPWFHHQPATDGSWDADKGKVDADIAFWRKLGAIAPVCIAPGVVIGHLEEVVAWPGQDLTPGHGQHQYVYDYFDHARPRGVFRQPIPQPDPRKVAAVQAAIDASSKQGPTP